MKITHLLSVAAVLLGAVSAPGQFVIQPLTEAASMDTKIYGTVPTSNFASNLNLTSSDTGAHFLSLVQFDLSSVTLASGQVTQAFLTLYCSGLGPSGVPGPLPGVVQISPILNAWRENAADPGAAPLATYDAFFGAVPSLAFGPVVASQTVSGAGFISWDITPLVQSWLSNPGTNFGVLIEAVGPLGDFGFADVDSSPGVPGSAPSLTVIPEPGTWILLVSGAAILFGLRRRASER